MEFSFFGRRYRLERAVTASNSEPYLTPASEEKTAYSASNAQESAYLTGIRSPGINVLSGAPDKPNHRLASPPDPTTFAGRKSKDTPQSNSFSNLWNTYSSRRRRWAATGLGGLDFENFDRLDFDQLTDLITELSPEVSKALWDYLLLTNAGFEVTAYHPQSREKFPKAQKALDGILQVIAAQHGSLHVFFDRIFKTIFMRGGYMTELVLQPNGRDFACLASPDPKTLEFRRTNDPVTGQGWTFGQRIDGEFKDLNLPNIRYVPLHPAPDTIEGTPILTSVFFLSIFLMATLRDVKRVVQHQGYLRLDVEIQFEKLLETIPDETRANPEELAAWMSKVVAKVEEVYSSLQPDDTYVHGDSIKINNPVGTVSADALAGVDALFKALERMSVRALKTMPLLLATDTTRGETASNREWEIYAKGIETVQHLVESPIASQLELALRAQGIQARVEVKFATFRAAEKMRDAQVDLLVAQFARFLYDSGIINMDEMAQLCGREKADQEAPRQAANSDPAAVQNAIQENPNPGENRQIYTDFLRILREKPSEVQNFINNHLEN